MKQSIRDVQNLSGKRVLVRVDYNVPQDATGAVTDDTRIRETLPTLQYLIEQQAKIVLVAHLGRPKGQVVESMRLKPIASVLAGLLPGISVQAIDKVVGPDVEAKVQALQPGDVLLLENVRFELGEETNDPAFAQKLAALADVYVNDAFGAAHRAHASTEGITHFVKESVAGLLMAREIEALGSILSNPARPFTAIVGGSKVSSKISVLSALIEKVDNLVIGGGMAYTFLLARGLNVGKCLVEPNFVETAKALEAKAKARGVQLVLSQDILVADQFSADAAVQTVDVTAIPAEWEGMDIGPKTRAEVIKVVMASKSILWNGPVGVFEFPAFSEGTRAVAEAVAVATQQGAKSVLGGGDTVAAIERFNMDPAQFTHVSTGGGASLEFIEGKELPGIKALADKQAAAV
jgi:phosphoglycerate kinase